MARVQAKVGEVMTSETAARRLCMEQTNREEKKRKNREQKTVQTKVQKGKKKKTTKNFEDFDFEGFLPLDFYLKYAHVT